MVAVAITEIPPELEGLPLRERRRRYEARLGADTSAGNGVADLPTPSPPCVICGAELSADRVQKRAKTCGDRCSREWRARRRGAQRETPTATTVAANGTAVDTDTSPAVSAAPGPPPGLWDVVLAAGVAVTALSFEYQQEQWTLTRSINGGSR
jgi:hypothetical protein